MTLKPDNAMFHAVLYVCKLYFQVRIRVIDVNDSPPEFSVPQYSAVIPENSLPGTPVIKIEATDPDLGEAGQVWFKFPETGRSVKKNNPLVMTLNFCTYLFFDLQHNDLFEIDSNTGEISTKAILTGKCRQVKKICSEWIQ